MPARVPYLRFGLLWCIGLFTFTLRDLLTPALLADLWGRGFLYSCLLLARKRKFLSHTSQTSTITLCQRGRSPTTHTHPHTHTLAPAPGPPWEDLGTEYLGCLPRLLSFAITAGRADPSRGGPAPRSQFFPGPRGLFLPSTPH